MAGFHTGHKLARHLLAGKKPALLAVGYVHRTVLDDQQQQVGEQIGRAAHQANVRFPFLDSSIEQITVKELLSSFEKRAGLGQPACFVVGGWNGWVVDW